ncbi:tRNA 2-thiouridine(34) synthase MnmA [Ureaplasma miroungigenitalium]|uniref:tRNA 2-thiouridine(34) synthase MnmA n=1 Tax=Ureaplasma miroungigenitalium TaxID=1042321 RepID=UPI0021E6D7E9|nr:tRNA 2-thiouridine(34) synthase MnmA [Ureaplasma miroungigenitalium]MCV3734279.1 tRNA 2-thiouridine(34) synthase MnmA [Ureaplasma miroungigenitalium]
MINKKTKTVVVGLSGGVDSAVSALLLKQQGYDVIGLFMTNWDASVNQELNFKSKQKQGCDNQKDLLDAKKVAEQIGIRFETIEFINQYWDNVFQHFLDEYQNNRTPNPDILCNQFIKFDAFLEYAMKHFDCDYIAMGHYAQIKHDKDHSVLLKAVDENKDQTYFLCNLRQNQLQKALFPIGHLTKKEVRQIAYDNKINVFDKKDSTGICFIGERNFVEFMNNYIPNQPGDIIDITTNKKIGEHIGTMYYTIGQNKGLHLGGQKSKMFVCQKDLQNKIIYVAPSELEWDYLMSNKAVIKNCNWNQNILPQMPLQVRFRHRQKLIDVVNIEFIKNDEAVIDYSYARAITPGQYAVFYQGDVCLGGGVIDCVYQDKKQLN